MSALGIASAVSPRQDALTIQASGAEVRRASEWLDAACRAHNVPQPLAERLALCLHEVLANIINHGGPAALAAPIRLQLDTTRDQGSSKASLTVSDAGMPFNPLSVPKRNLPKTLAEAPVGGLGLVMIHRFADGLDYRHEDGQNHLTFGVGWRLQ